MKIDSIDRELKSAPSSVLFPPFSVLSAGSAEVSLSRFELLLFWDPLNIFRTRSSRPPEYSHWPGHKGSDPIQLRKLTCRVFYLRISGSRIGLLLLAFRKRHRCPSCTSPPDQEPLRWGSLLVLSPIPGKSESCRLMKQRRDSSSVPSLSLSSKPLLTSDRAFLNQGLLL